MQFRALIIRYIPLGKNMPYTAYNRVVTLIQIHSKQHYSANHSHLLTDITTKHSCKLCTHLKACCITILHNPYSHAVREQSTSESMCRFSTDGACQHACHVDLRLLQLMFTSGAGCCSHALKNALHSNSCQTILNLLHSQGTSGEAGET